MKPRLRWRKNKRPTGLMGVCSGNPGHSLMLGEDMLGGASEHRRGWGVNQTEGWYWHVKNFPPIPYKNTCNEPPQTEEDAKQSAMEYVRKCLAKSTSSN